MNYYNPYFFSAPANTSLISRIFGKLNLSSLLSGANKTLNFVNQTIPVIKQVSPMVKNFKTIFNVVNEFKKADEPKKEVKTSSLNQKSIKQDINKPTFFV